MGLKWNKKQIIIHYCCYVKKWDDWANKRVIYKVTMMKRMYTHLKHIQGLSYLSIKWKAKFYHTFICAHLRPMFIYFFICFIRYNINKYPFLFFLSLIHSFKLYFYLSRSIKNLNDLRVRLIDCLLFIGVLHSYVLDHFVR